MDTKTTTPQPRIPDVFTGVLALMSGDAQRKAEQQATDHIQKRDRRWTDNDMHRGTAYGSEA